MNPDKLLDAIGMVDDRFFITENNRRHFPVRKAITGLIAAILVFALSVGTVMAVSPQFREFISLFSTLKLPNYLLQARQNQRRITQNLPNPVCRKLTL